MNWEEPTEIGMVVQCDGIVTNLEFHDQGQYLAITTNQSAIHFVDCLSGIEKKKIFVKKDGIGKVQFSHHEMCLLMSAQQTSPENQPCYDIKYLSVYDNRYLRYFRGHTSTISSLSMNPINDQFISASVDGTVRIWDINSPAATAKISLPLSSSPSPAYPQGRPPLCAHDSAGIIFGVLHHNSLKLYDARNYEQGPYVNIFPDNAAIYKAYTGAFSASESSYGAMAPGLTEAQIQRYLYASWVNFEFSADGGNSVLVNTNTEAMLLLDGLNPTVEPRVLTSRKNESGQQLGATFTADAKYVVTGSEDNEILYYDRNTLELAHTLTGHVAPVGKLRCNRVYDVMASGCVNAVLWIQSNDNNILGSNNMNISE